MPAAAVIPAPIAYIKVVAVKKLVVGFPFELAPPLGGRCRARAFLGVYVRTSLYDVFGPDFYFEEIRVFQAGVRLEYISME